MREEERVFRCYLFVSMSGGISGCLSDDRAVVLAGTPHSSFFAGYLFIHMSSFLCRVSCNCVMWLVRYK